MHIIMPDINKYSGLSIVMPNYNGAELLKTFLPDVLIAVSNYSGKSEVIVVDDHSTDNSIEILNTFANIILVRHDMNAGFQRTCNTGLANSQYEVVFFLNTDVKLAPDYFSYFKEYFKNEDTFAVTPQGYDYRTGDRLDGGKIGYWKKGHPRVTQNYYLQDHPTLQPPYLSFAVQGAYFFADRDKMIDLGGFDELMAPFIFEETDLSYRALKRGWKIYYEPRCQAWHKHSSTIASISSERKRKMISYRNRMIFVWKNIQDPGYLASHLIYVFLRLLIFPSRIMWTAFASALKMLPQIRAKRKIEKLEQVLNDKEIFNSFKSYYKKHNIL